MNDFQSVTFRVHPYLATHDHFYDNGRQFLWKKMTRDLAAFKKSHPGTEWIWRTGDSYVMDVEIKSTNVKTALNNKDIESFKALVKTFGVLVNEIYSSPGRYQHHHLKTFQFFRGRCIGHNRTVYWTDKNADQYRKHTGTHFYWVRFKENDYKYSYYDRCMSYHND